ncbi:hypothetical protein [Corynebacterium flavescens]|uniref:hypothetical protein n=1 Tax=Corynebacterium flavescens TaxID=28028 RepID=UPI003FD2B6CF
MQYIRTINGYEIDPDAPTRKEDVERMISKCCDVFPDGLDLPEFGNYEPLFPYLTDHVHLSLCHTKAGGEINVTAVHSDTLGWHWQGVVTDDDGQVVETVRGVLDLEDIPEGSDITMDLDDLERWFTDYAEAQVRDFIRTGDTSGNDIHSQVLTSPDGLRAAEVTWREETILTNDRMPYQPITLWDEDDCPVFWDTRSNRWELVTVPTPRQVNLQGSLNGNYQTFCDVGRVKCPRFCSA